ncbi:MAG: Integrase, partial [uncultured Rubrobacteraceae bacterium]
MAKRRGNGEGSVYRRKDGLWVGQYKVQTSKGIKTKYIYSKTRKEAASKLAAAIAERNSGVVYDSEGLTVGDYLVEWLQSVRGTVRERTWKRSEEVVRLHLVPALGKTRLDKLNALQVQALYRSKLESGLSARTVRMVHTTLHKALKQAVRWSLIPRNVAEAVDPPRERNTEVRPLDEGQVKSLLRAARGERFETLYILAVTTGMRSGELLGLQWGDVDLEAGTLQVRRTVFNGRIEAPKTSKGRRSIRLTQTSVEALRERPRASEWVFCTRTGRPVSVHNVHNRSWKPLLRKAGLPPET